MKELLQQYAAYNFWATKSLVNVISKLNQEEIDRTVVSSFPSLYLTVKHLWLAEEVWWKRLKLLENIELESNTFTGNFNELAIKLAKQSQLWIDWVNNASENQLTHVFAYVRNKEQMKMPVYQMLLHLFNHGSYHRGQIVTMLRQLGVDKIPSTDFTTFCRGK